jgi:Protein of unknown function (DUF2281)
MTTLITTELKFTNKLVELLKDLPIERQKEILDFAEFVAQKHQKESNNNLSFYDVAKEFIGSVDSGLKDLSTNKKYLEESLSE